MLSILDAFTHKKGDLRPGEKDDKVHASIGKPTGEPRKPLPKPFTPKEEIGKTTGEIFDRWAQSMGYSEWREVKQGFNPRIRRF